MSESASKSLISESTVTYFGVVAAVIVAAAVFAVAYAARSADTPAVNADLRKQRVDLRLEVEGAGRKLITEYGRNTDGTYRIPADKAAELIVANPDAALAALRASAK